MATINNPEKIGRYQVLERVGKGGMGVLYRGIDPVLDREVAIKVMLLDFSEDEEQMRPRFYREARASAKLQHRNIVTVFEFAEEGNTPFIVMEFLRGVPLSERMASPVPMSLDAKLDVIAQLCDALNYAHEQGVVHRDVKPANVFILNDGSAKLLDFGIAKITTSTLTQKGDILGSASYMSPEQVAGSDSVDGRSDIFSAGVVLYELIAGRKPFQAEAPTAIIMKILHEDPPSLNLFVPGLPAQLVNAVNRALAKDPADRFATAGELAKELQWIRKALQAAGDGAAVLDETRFATPTEIRAFQKDAEKSRAAIGGSRAASPATADEPAESGGRNWAVLGGIAAVAVAAIVGGYFVLGRGSAPAAGDAKPPAAVAASATPAAAGGAGAAAAAPGAAAAAPKSVSLQVNSDPTGAAISLDGKSTNQTTPAAIMVSGGGEHKLRLVKRGFTAKDAKLGDADLQAGSVRYNLDPEVVATVPVSVTSAYPVEVWDNSKSISAASESHKLNVAAGATLHIRAPKYFLDASVKVDGKQMDYQSPPLGYLSVLTKYETCSVKIGSQDLGYPPITKLPLVSGQYRVDIACPTGQSPPGQFVTVAPNGTATARIY